MDQKPPDEVDTSAEESRPQEQRADGLKSLLEEEASGLEPEDEELADLFDDVEEQKAATPRAPRRGREARRARKLRDLDEYRGLEAHLQATPMGLQISEDKMSVSISKITADSTEEEILALLKAHGVRAGIDRENIRSALAKVRTGAHQYEVVIARGKQPKIASPAEILHHLPEELIWRKRDEKTTPFERLKLVLEGSYLEAVKSWAGPVKIVRKGELLSELRLAEIEPGYNVYGEKVTMEERTDLELRAGENTILSAEGTQCRAEIYGYAGLIEEVPTVLAPLWISEDHQEARFVYFSPAEPGPAPSEEELRELLELKWIEAGLLLRQLELIRRRLAEGQPLPITLPIAQGRKEIPGENARIHYVFDPYELMTWNQLQSILQLKTSEAIEHALDSIYLPEEENSAGAPGLRFKAFRPGEVVAEKIPATPGMPGLDVQGEEIAPDEGEDVPLEIGDHLELTQDGLRAMARYFAYASMRWDIQLNLFLPVWIAPDRTRAYFLNLPQGASPRYPSLEEMLEVLDLLGIKYGFHPERWLETLAELEAGGIDAYLVPIAEALPAQKGRNAEFEWAIEIGEKKPGRILEDGSIDYRDRNLGTMVKEGDLLGKLVPPRPGVPGKDVFGNVLQPSHSLNIEIVTDSRIYAEPDESAQMSFYVETGGGISTTTQIKKIKTRTQKRINIAVYPISTIEHDVDYSTGNIDFNGDVVIGGSVQPQFSVRATGSVTIGGYIEAGAYVTAGGDIIVKRGVVGASTELVAGGDVMAKFIQEATIRAGGAVKAGSYIFNASVRAGGEVVVAGKGEGKSRALVGGLIWGARGIRARAIGSPYNTGTRLVAGIDPDQVNRAEQIRANMRACQEKQRGFLEVIGIEQLDVELIKQKLSQCASAKQRRLILQAVKRIAKIADLEKNQQEELEQIAAEQRKLALKAGINVMYELFSGVEIRIGEQTTTVQEDGERLSFRLVKDKDELKIQRGPLRR